MAQRKQKAARPQAGASAPSEKAARGAGGRPAAADPATKDRDQLISELAAARARIAELEQQREQLVNRIDWVIDSLNSLLDSDA